MIQTFQTRTKSDELEVLVRLEIVDDYCRDHLGAYLGVPFFRFFEAELIGPDGEVWLFESGRDLQRVTGLNWESYT